MTVTSKEGEDLVDQVRNAKRHPFGDDGSVGAINEHPQRRPSNVEGGEQFRRHQPRVRTIQPGRFIGVRAGEEKYFNAEFVISAVGGFEQLGAPVTGFLDRNDEMARSERVTHGLAVGGDAAKGCRYLTRSWGVKRLHQLFGVSEGLDRAPVTAPAARHRVDRALNHLGLFDGQFAAHREVVEGTDRRRLRYIKSGEVATGRASEAIHDMQTRGLGTETLRPSSGQRRAR